VTAGKIDLSGTFDFSSGTVSVAAPSSANHAASKSYVDNIANGLHWKDSVKVATVSNITLSGTQTIDGIAISADERVLVRAQTSGSENGIYLCKAGSWSRAADMDAAGEFSGSAVFVQQGSTYADIGFVCTNDGDVTVGTTAITFTQFSGAGQFTAGDGLDLTGTTFSVNVDDSSIEISSDSLRVKASGITNAMLAGSIANAKLANSTISGVALGSNLNSLTAGNGISMTSYNGSAAVSDLTIDLDGSSLAVGSDGIKVADGGIANSMIQDGVIANAKLANSTISGVALGANLNALSVVTGSALTMTSYNGSAARSDLAVQVDDSSIEINSNALRVKALGVTNAMLAGSITAAKLAGSIPADKLNKGAGLADNGGNLEIASGVAGDGLAISSQVLSVNVDDTGIEINSDTLRLKDAGVTTSKLGADCVTNAKIADDAVQTENLNFAGLYTEFNASAAQTTFELGSALDLEFKKYFMVTVNGLGMRYADSPSAADQYKIDNGGSGSVGRIVFGSGLEASDVVIIRAFVNN
jgi:hypothetical protein